MAEQDNTVAKVEIEIATLRRIPLLAQLPLERLTMLVRHMRLLKFAKGSLVVRKGDKADVLCFLFAGRLQVVDTTANGRELALGYIEPLSHFGELALLDGQPRSTHIVAVEDAWVAVLPSAIALEVMFTEASICAALMRQMARTIRQTNAHLLAVGSTQASSRVARLLVHFASAGVAAEGAGVAAEGGEEPGFDLPPQQVLANMACTTRETVSRILSQLQAEQLLQKQGRQYRILDWDKLIERYFD